MRLLLTLLLVSFFVSCYATGKRGQTADEVLNGPCMSRVFADQNCFPSSGNRTSKSAKTTPVEPQRLDAITR